MIAGVHEQLGPYKVQDQELVGLQLQPEATRIAVDLVRCCDPGVPHAEGAVRDAAPANNRFCTKLVAAHRLGLVGARLQHPVPFHCPAGDLQSPAGQWTGPMTHADAMTCLLPGMPTPPPPVVSDPGQGDSNQSGYQYDNGVSEASAAGTYPSGP
jgi:hypothetical protein